MNRWLQQPQPFPPHIQDRTSIHRHFQDVRNDLETKCQAQIPDVNWTAFVQWVYRQRDRLPRSWHIAWTRYPVEKLGIWRPDQDVLWFNPAMY